MHATRVPRWSPGRWRKIRRTSRRNREDLIREFSRIRENSRVHRDGAFAGRSSGSVDHEGKVTRTMTVRRLHEYQVRLDEAEEEMAP